LSVVKTSSGLSTGTKAPIGVGVTLGVILLIPIIILAVWYGMRTAKKKAATESIVAAAEPGAKNERGELAGKPLNNEELERRRAVELEGKELMSVTEVKVNERTELEARRGLARDLYEIGGYVLL